MKESNGFHQSQDRLTLLLGNEILPQSAQSLTPTSAFLKCNNLFFKGNKHSLRSSILTSNAELKLIIIQVQEIISTHLHNYFQDIVSS